MPDHFTEAVELRVAFEQQSEDERVAYVRHCGLVQLKFPWIPVEIPGISPA